MTEGRRGLGFGGFLTLSVLVIVVAAAAGIIPFRQTFAQERAVDLARSQRDALIDENLRLEHQIAALQTPGEVERLAREQFGLVMPGETAYVAVPDPEGVSLPTVPVVELEDLPSWWENLWNFITGGDLVADE